VHVGALRADLHLAQARSLKDKRAVIRPILDGCRQRFSVAAAEVGYQDRWQRAELAAAAVSASAAHVTEMLDAVERFIWSFPEVEVVAMSRHWLEVEDQ
jgi:uncharacterized protein YlxP (DUF503 family)